MTTDPVQPVDASTVILVRELPGGGPWECFMVRRHVRSEFAADVFVFPGGKVDAADSNPELVQTAPPPNAGQTGFADDAEMDTALRLAAIRELFEEAGVLLARREGEGLVRLTGEDKTRFARYRERLHSRQTTLLDIARVENLRYATDLLHPFSHWVTPPTAPRRYDTRFFVAEMPEAQEPLHDALETTDSTWISPDEALRRYREGGFPLVFATERHLERMARYPSIQTMLQSIGPDELKTIMPKVIERDGERSFLIPGDPGF